MASTWNDDVVMKRVKQALLADAGINGLRAATLTFRQMDKNNDQTLSPEEFENGLLAHSVKLSKAELQYLVRAFDTDGDGRVTLQEFIKGLIGTTNPRRKAMITKAYGFLAAKSPQGAIAASEIVNLYDAGHHPAVLMGRLTTIDVEREILGAFGIDSDKDGLISQEEFEAFFAGMSAVMPSDDVFEEMMLKCFKMDNSKKPQLSSTAREWGENGDPLAAKPQRLKDAHSGTLYAAPHKGYDHTSIQRPFQQDPPIGRTVKRDYVTTMKRDYPNYSSDQCRTAIPDGVRNKASPTGDPLIDRVRSRILERSGDEGFVGLQRAFRIIDKNRDSKIDAKELAEGLKRIRIDLTPGEQAAVMAYMDRNSSGDVTVTEFLRGIRGPLTNPARIEIILEAFQRLDKDGSGVISLDEIAPRYDTTRHPAVVSGRKTKDQVIREFIADWDGNHDGNITLEEWKDYHANLSAGIDDDQYFELMIRNAWHISGGTGVAQNTTCRRVCATFADGTERVLEIKDDIGIRHDNTEEMMRRLKAQGHQGIVEIKLHM